MKGAIASVDFFLTPARPAAGDTRRADAPGAGRESVPTPRRLTLTLTAPERDRNGAGWSCRVALADLHRPLRISGRDSVEALARAIDQARDWLAELRAQGGTLSRDRSGETPFEPF